MREVKTAGFSAMVRVERNTLFINIILYIKGGDAYLLSRFSGRFAQKRAFRFMHQLVGVGMLRPALVPGED